MLDEHKVQILDKILAVYYESRHGVGELILGPQFRIITGSNANMQWFIDKLSSDDLVIFVDSGWTNGDSISGKITDLGKRFYEKGGYSSQVKNVEKAHREEALLREREVKTNEQSAESAERSAMSAERSAMSAERSATSAERANTRSTVSIVINVIVFLVGTSLTLWQNNRTNEQNAKVDSLNVKVKRLDSLLIKNQLESVLIKPNTIKPK